jgi:flavin-dependent dehydrogenase
MIRAEVAVIGAGPAGAATAIRLGQLGITDVVLVDRSDFPREKTCGSGVSPAGLDMLAALGVWEQVRPHAYRIGGLRLVTPRGHAIHLSGGESASAIICCRRTLDHQLVAGAQRLGVRFIPRFRAEALIAERGRVLGFSARDGREVRARYTVVADGAHSRFAVGSTAKRTIHTVMGWWEDVPFTAHHVEMVFDAMVSPLLWRGAVRSSFVDGLVATAQQPIVGRALARLMAHL